MMEENQEQGPGLDIELTEEIAEGIYSNFAIITHSQTEFIVDFVRMMPGIPKGKVKTRIILVKFLWKKVTGCLHTRCLLALVDQRARLNPLFNNLN